jgi:hypothetical protein
MVLWSGKPIAYFKKTVFKKAKRQACFVQNGQCKTNDVTQRDRFDLVVRYSQPLFVLVHPRNLQNTVNFDLLSYE